VRTITKTIHIPLLIEPLDKPNWEILEDEIAIIDYINEAKSVLHLNTSNGLEIFCKKPSNDYKVGDFVSGKLLTIRRKDKTFNDVKNLSKISSDQGILAFPLRIAIVDHINEDKKLFHFVVDDITEGIVRFSESHLRPEEGNFIAVRLVKKLDKKRRKVFYKAIEIQETDEKNNDLLKSFQGDLELKYKRYGEVENYFDLSQQDRENLTPDFAFVSDIYVPQQVLINHKIKHNCYVCGKAILSRNKWKVIELEEIQ
jgi:hypothetical protein